MLSEQHTKEAIASPQKRPKQRYQPEEIKTTASFPLKRKEGTTPPAPGQKQTKTCHEFLLQPAELIALLDAHLGGPALRIHVPPNESEPKASFVDLLPASPRLVCAENMVRFIGTLQVRKNARLCVHTVNRLSTCNRPCDNMSFCVKTGGQCAPGAQERTVCLASHPPSKCSQTSEPH